MNIVTIDTADLTLNDLINVAVHNYQVVLGPTARTKIESSRTVVDKLVENNTVAYGVNTGFGYLANTNIDQKDCATLQLNLIRSHAVGIGEPSPTFIARGMFLLRLKCIANGNSGVRLCTAEKIVEAINKNFIPLVWTQGSVGASGDLAPLSNLFLGLLGEGKALDPDTNTYISAKLVLEKLNIAPMDLSYKEGLALNNGTQFITSWTAYVTYHALRILDLASIITATTIEALHGVPNAFDARVQEVKPHSGQIEVATQIRSILFGDPNQPCIRDSASENIQTNTIGKVQDAYSLRCVPQIHGASYDLIKFVEKHVLIEMNCSNDNPLVLDQDVVSGGNFHGMYIGMIADQLALAFSYLCNVSERRLERMVNSDLNKFMPAMLAKNPGLNSGLMIVQYASAGVTAENRNLANPGSVDSISTCMGCEDVVSMGAWPARKAVKSMENTYRVLALELFTANQALHFTQEQPNQVTAKIIAHLRQTIPFIETDVYMGDYIEQVIEFVKSDRIFELAGLESHLH